MNTSTLSPLNEKSSSIRSIDIELLALDQKTWTRCVGSQANLEQALAAAQHGLQVTGHEVQVQTMLIESEEQARRQSFVTLPTIRINGRDIALETVESHCDSCTDLCGCEEGKTVAYSAIKGKSTPKRPSG